MALTKVSTGMLSADAASVDLNIDAGTLFIDASANRVGVANTSPATALDVTGTVTADGLTVEGNGTYLASLNNTAQDARIQLSRGGTEFGQVSAGANLMNLVASGSSTDMRFLTNSLERMRINASGNVGIGTSAPAQALVVKRSSGDTYLDIARDTQAQGQVALQLSGGTSGTNWIMYQDASSNDLKFYGNSSNRMVLDASGNLIVSGTAAGQATSVALHNDGYVHAVSSHQQAAIFDRRDSDGAQVIFRKDGTAVGSIGNIEDILYIATDDTTDCGIRFDGDNQEIVPCNATGARVDGTIDLGDGSGRFKDLYLSGGVYLGGTGAANKLDDYEEGTWTPSFSGAGSPSYSTQTGRYTKIGRVVYCTIAMRATSVSGTSNIEIAGLPFTPVDAGDTTQRSTYSPFLGGHCSGLSEATGRFRVLTNTNLAGVKGSTGTSFMTAAEFSSGGSPQITGDFLYYTS